MMTLSFLAAEISTVYKQHTFLLHPSAVGHLGCFWNLANVNSAVLNTEEQVSEMLTLSPSGKQ